MLVLLNFILKKIYYLNIFRCKVTEVIFIKTLKKNFQVLSSKTRFTLAQDNYEGV